MARGPPAACPAPRRQRPEASVTNVVPLGRRDEGERTAVTLGKLARDGEAVAMTRCCRSARSRPEQSRPDTGRQPRPVVGETHDHHRGFGADLNRDRLKRARLAVRNRDGVAHEVEQIRNISSGSTRPEALPLWPISKEKSFGAAGASRSAAWRAIPIKSTPHLRRVLKSFARYYNEMRTHRSLDKDAPISRPVQRTGSIISHALSADCITTTSESEFSVHTPGQANEMALS